MYALRWDDRGPCRGYLGMRDHQGCRYRIESSGEYGELIFAELWGSLHVSVCAHRSSMISTAETRWVGLVYMETLGQMRWRLLRERVPPVLKLAGEKQY